MVFAAVAVAAAVAATILVSSVDGVNPVPARRCGRRWPRLCDNVVVGGDVSAGLVVAAAAMASLARRLRSRRARRRY